MKIGESFYSVQGEGVSFGIPSYFIRLQGCNLMCGGHNGELVKQGKASWYCDSEDVWRKGKITTNNNLLQKIFDAGQLNNVLEGKTHLIWTGGEPTLPMNLNDIRSFLNYIYETYKSKKVYNEIETNGTIVTPNEFYKTFINQINCSPKLSNSGMSYNKRINPDALKQINDSDNSWFKFVVNNENDIKELKKNIVDKFELYENKVLLMPGVDNDNDLSTRMKFIFDMSKKYGYRASTRGQILAYNQTTGI